MSFSPSQPRVEIPLKGFDNYSENMQHFREEEKKYRDLSQKLDPSQQSDLLKSQFSMIQDQLGCGTQGEQLRIICCGNNMECLKPGKLSCSNCHLVAYCSKECQQKHWKKHKIDCKSEISRPDWAPDPNLIRSVSIRDDDDMIDKYMKLVSCFLWGNVQAFDVINYEKNEGTNPNYKQNSYNILFAASGDIRLLLQSAQSIKKLADHCDTINIYLNDYNALVTVRNILMLHLLTALFDKGIDFATQIWYSSALTYKQALYFLKTRLDVAQGLQNTDKQTIRAEIQKKLETLFMSFDISEETFNMLLQILVKEGILQSQLFEALNERNEKFNRSQGLIYRNYAKQKPYYRQSFDYFRNHGIFLPMSSTNAHLNTINKYIMHPENGWVLDHQSNPIYGWPMKKVMSSNPYNVPKHDLYGRLFFYVIDRLQELVDVIKMGKIKFKIFNKNAKDLLQEFQAQGLKFDRIDVSNISDENYIGMEACLKLSSPLLNQSNSHSKLITILMNWISKTEFAPICSGFMQNIGGAQNNPKNQKKIQKVIGKLLDDSGFDKQNLFSLFDSFNSGSIITDLIQKYVDKHGEVLEDYLLPFDKVGHAVGLQRAQNSIVSLKSDFENDVIENLNDSVFERFIEWQLT